MRLDHHLTKELSESSLTMYVRPDSELPVDRIGDLNVGLFSCKNVLLLKVPFARIEAPALPF